MFRVNVGDVEAKVPGRYTAPDPRRLHLHPGTLRAQVHGVRNIQCALGDHGGCTNSCVRGSLDGEGSGVLTVVLGGLAPGPGALS